MANVIGEQLGSVFSFSPASIGSALITLLFFVLIASLIGFVMYFVYKSYLKKKNYPLKVEIFYQEPGSSSPIKKYDRGGIFFKKKTNLKRFWLLKHNIGLDPDNLPFIFNERGQRVITLWQDGLRSFRYCNWNITSNPGLHMGVGEEDVNWAIAVYNEWKSKFSTQSWLEKYGAYVIFIFAVIGVLVLVYFVFDKFEVISQAANSLSQVASSLEKIELARGGQILE